VEVGHIRTRRSATRAPHAGQFVSVWLLFCILAHVPVQAREAAGAWLQARPPRAAPADDGTRIAAQIVAFAEARLGRQVGDGECFALADLALHSAGARSAAAFAAIGPDSDYIWGRAIPLGAIRPGDILQFRNYMLQVSVTRSVRLAGGGEDITQSVDGEERGHHTAIVERVEGGTIIVLEQNVDPTGRVVQRNRLPIKSGTEITFVPGGEIRTDIAVEGSIRAYRPLPAGNPPLGLRGNLASAL
jgi:hypothetical protein